MNKRRLGALALTAAIAGGTITSGTAQAVDEPTIEELFSAQAAASVARLNLLGNTFALGELASSIDFSSVASDPLSAAEASAEEIITPIFSTDKVTSAVKNAAGTTETGGAEASCLLDGLEAVPGIHSVVDFDCPRVTAGITDAGNPFSESVGALLKLDLSVAELLQTLGLDEVVAGTGDAYGDDNDDGLDDTVLDTLSGLVSGITGVEEIDTLIDDTTTTVDNLVEKVLGLDSTVRLVLGGDRVSTVSDNDTIKARGDVGIARVELLNLSSILEGTEYDGIIQNMELDQPFITIAIGEAWGEQTATRGIKGAVNDATGDSSLVRIKINGIDTPLIDQHVLPVLDAVFGPLLPQVNAGVESLVALLGDADANTALSWEDGEFVLRGPGVYTFLEGTPLETTISISAVDVSNGFAVTGVGLSTLPDINGGIDVELASVSGGGVQSADTVVLGSVLEQPLELARTGGTPWIPLVGMAMLGIALAGRRLTAVRIER
ncbi:MAG TPA: hypothetical protein VGA13_04990 [Acidimicrobiales bacterium]